MQDGRVTYLEGRCLSYGSNIPYYPINDLLRNNCGIIEIDIPKRTLILRVAEEEIQARLSKLPEFEMKVKTGYLARYAWFVSSADKGAVFPK